MQEPIAISSSREAGLLKSYILHTRPKSWAPAFVFAATGYLLEPTAHEASRILFDLAGLFFVYSVLLWGGTSAYNTFQDGDEGPLNYLENPPPVPTGLNYFGVALMATAVLLSSLLWGAGAALLSLAAFALSIAYSKRWPRSAFRGKEVGVLDNLINSSGCGWIAVYLGWIASSGGSLEGAHLLALAFTVSVFGTYPATQIHQMKESDDYSTAKNYASLLGPTLALRAAAILIGVAWVMLLGVTVNWTSGEGAFQFGGNLQFAAFCVFTLLFLIAAIQCWRWASAPFDSPHSNFRRLIQIMLAARISYIVAGNLTV